MTKTRNLCLQHWQVLAAGGEGVVWQNMPDWESNGWDYRLLPPVGAAWETGTDEFPNEVNEMVCVEDGGRNGLIIGIKDRKKSSREPQLIPFTLFQYMLLLIQNSLYKG